jgi:hypothetical protein
MLSVNCEKAFQFYFIHFFHEVMKVEQKIVKKKRLGNPNLNFFNLIN